MMQIFPVLSVILSYSLIVIKLVHSLIFILYSSLRGLYLSSNPPWEQYNNFAEFFTRISFLSLWLPSIGIVNFMWQTTRNNKNVWQFGKPYRLPLFTSHCYYFTRKYELVFSTHSYRNILHINGSTKRGRTLRHVRNIWTNYYVRS
jgi:hypothetical protein